MANCLNMIRINIKSMHLLNLSWSNQARQCVYFRFYSSPCFTWPPSLLKDDKINQINETVLTSQIIDEFRKKGHFLSSIDPISSNRDAHQETKLLRVLIEKYKDDETSIDVTRLLSHYQHPKSCTIKQMIAYLQTIYCSSVGIECMYINKQDEYDWIVNQWEQLCSINEAKQDNEHLKQLATLLIKSELFDQFVGIKFPTVKRYSGEGAESLLIILNTIFREACLNHKVKNVVVGMPHRGRLNFLDILLKVPAVKLFHKMSGQAEIDLKLAPFAKGDVLSHLFSSVDLHYDQQNCIHISLLPNPSHLEAVCPVVCGKARAKGLNNKGSYLDRLNEKPFDILPVHIHGDAAFCGQGVIMETLSMSKLDNFKINGSFHIVVNNNLGYTTPGHSLGRSSFYCSDVMKMIEVPCIHVNGDCPQDVYKATKLALEYRQKFGKDVLIDLNCFRRWGHNELDDPTYTNPLMYQKIHARGVTMPSAFAASVLTPSELEIVKEEYKSYLNDQFQNKNAFKPKNDNLQNRWSSMSSPSINHTTVWNTGIPLDIARYVGAKSIEIKDGFTLHSNLQKVLIKARQKRLLEGSNIDWSTSEAIAFGSLLYQGFNIRISGQDVGRGTFSQRHAMIFDQLNNQKWVPLNSMNKGFFEVVDSHLSEEAVLGFEYGFSIESPQNLVIWEAQFGDFFNGAQIILDTFVSTGESKWLLQSGLVILLPHGYDGAGPEHSSCRIERFLQICNSSETKCDSDAINWSIAYPTTPSQYFHLLRRQMIRNYRKPIIIVSPKLLLRHPSCVSSLNEFKEGTHFKPVLADPSNFPDDQIRKVIFCSGKHFYHLDQVRQEKGIQNMAIIRIEELCPFPVKEIHLQLLRYKNAKGEQMIN